MVFLNLEQKKWSFIARYKQILMTQDKRGGKVGIYSSGVKMTLKVGLAPMETTPFIHLSIEKRPKINQKKVQLKLEMLIGLQIIHPFLLKNIFVSFHILVIPGSRYPTGQLGRVPIMQNNVTSKLEDSSMDNVPIMAVKVNCRISTSMRCITCHYEIVIFQSDINQKTSTSHAT